MFFDGDLVNPRLTSLIKSRTFVLCAMLSGGQFVAQFRSRDKIVIRSDVQVVYTYKLSKNLK